MEKALERVAEQILSFDEASMSSLREKYRSKIEHFDGTKDWEKSVIIYCIINAKTVKRGNSGNGRKLTKLLKRCMFDEIDGKALIGADCHRR